MAILQDQLKGYQRSPAQPLFLRSTQEPVPFSAPAQHSSDMDNAGAPQAPSHRNVPLHPALVPPFIVSAQWGSRPQSAAGPAAPTTNPRADASPADHVSDIDEPWVDDLEDFDAVLDLGSDDDLVEMVVPVRPRSTLYGAMCPVFT